MRVGIVVVGGVIVGCDVTEFELDIRSRSRLLECSFFSETIFCSYVKLLLKNETKNIY